MKHLYEMAVHKPVIVTIALVTLLVLGSISVYKLPIEFFPEMDFPFIGIIVPYPNALPSQVEKQITKPLEDVLSTLGDVRQVFSESSPDGAFIGVMFDWGRDVDVLRMEVKEKVDLMRGELPRDIERIQLLTFDSNDQPIMVGRISAKGRDLMGSYDLLERSIINPLKRIDGVGQVGIDGILPEEVSIYLEMDRLKAHRVDVGLLFNRIESMNVTTSLGEVTSAGLRYNVRGIGSFTRFEQIENLVIDESGLRLRDVATVYYGEPLITYGRHLDGEPCIAFWIQRASGANSVELGRRVQRQLEKINQDPRLDGVNVLLFWNQSEQILNSLHGLLVSGLIGSLLAVVVLYFFLRRVATTLIIAVSIPFAVLCACGFLYFTGRTLNVLTMMGLMLGVGMLVDNAIVVLESVFRHQIRHEDAATAAVLGSKEVAVAVTASTLTSVIVFAPVIFTKDSEGLMSMLAHVGITISVALIFSWVISLTLIPFLASRMRKPKKERASHVLSGVEERYVGVLRWTTVKHPYVTGLVIIPLALVLSIAAAKVLKLEANMEEGELIENLYISYEFSDNLTYDQTEKWVDEVESVLFERRKELGVTRVYSYYADNEAGTTIYFEDKYLSENKLKETRKKIKETLPQLAGVTLRFGDEEGEGSGGVRRIRVTLFGEDMDLLNEYAGEAKRRLALVEGLEDVRTSAESGREEISITLDRAAGQQYNLSPQTVSGIMSLTFRGMPLRRFQTAEREVPMTISLSPEDKVGIHNLENLLVGMNEGKELTLGTVAGMSVSRGPTTIRRQHQKAAVSVEGAYYRGEAKDMTKKVSGVMNTMRLPLGYSWSFSDEFRREQERQTEMLLNILLAVVCVYLVMAALFESLLHPLIIMSCLPFSFIGVIWALLATGTDLGLMVFIGLVILIGIVVNNGIVLVDHVNNFRREGRGIHEAIFEGGRERLRPILMTATTTILGLAPMAAGQTNIAGTQYYPLARAVIGGLAVGTFLTLVALPTYYVIGERLAAWTRSTWAKASIADRPRRGADPPR
jgi:HAE1 family hydrophobic/amphiphilic exporter-1